MLGFSEPKLAPQNTILRVKLPGIRNPELVTLKLDPESSISTISYYSIYKMKATTIIVSILSATAMVSSAPVANPQFQVSPDNQFHSNIGSGIQQWGQDMVNQYVPQPIANTLNNLQGVPGFGPHPVAQFFDWGLNKIGLRRLARRD
ncbi:hypothetical protein TWF192_007911 [Orbilia oligospora]|uniref:Uncharacterized protein n=1 Tax=Orbilia oligospora TaxID=2813651 RepID=A0A6G1M5J7_ORBOL|nr:hypothetical protein TWF191_003050 [Orbilia oligospora]KAF3243844.1 hypothetical protein TWF192_007911 [Orbilia oligospora]